MDAMLSDLDFKFKEYELKLSIDKLGHTID